MGYVMQLIHISKDVLLWGSKDNLALEEKGVPVRKSVYLEASESE